MTSNGPGRIETYSGRFIDPLDPHPDDLYIVDIAHALSNICRFTGHVHTFFSVGQHSVLVAQKVPRAHALSALLHDAPEAFLNDVARPLKRQPAVAAVYEPAEARLMALIAEKFGATYPLPACVKEADDLLLRMEARDLLSGATDWWVPGPPLPDEPITPWSPRAAKRRFLEAFEALS